jgi:hypothetical protein
MRGAWSRDAAQQLVHMLLPVDVARVLGISDVTVALEGD